MKAIDGIDTPEMTVTEAEFDAAGGLARIINGALVFGKTEMENKLTTPDVAKMFGYHNSTAKKWAVKNRLEFITMGTKHVYLWGKEGIERFAAREKPGRRWYKDNKKSE